MKSGNDCRSKSSQEQPKGSQQAYQCDTQTDACYDAVVVTLPGSGSIVALLTYAFQGRLEIANRRIDLVMVQVFDVPVWLGVRQHETFL